jgi:hypothetical protein
VRPDENKNKTSKKKIILLSVLGALGFAGVVAGSMFTLSKIKARTSEASTQEQFVGQAQSSDQLQAECQNSADELIQNEDLNQAFDEYKKHAENCREVYISSVDESRNYRSEGMYPDLAEDLIKRAQLENKTLALDILKFAKELPAWEFYQGPIVCSSAKVLDAWEELLKSNAEKVCYKPSEFQEKVVGQLKDKNFAVLELLQSNNSVAWLGSPESDTGCPEKLSSIIKISQNATAGGVQIKDGQRATEQNVLSVVFAEDANSDKLILEFAPQADGCVRFEAALVPNLQTNE